LETFVEKELISRVNTAEGSMRYDGLTESEIIDYHDHELDELINDFFQKRSISNFNLKDIRLLIIGDKINPSKKVEIKKIV